MNAQGKIRYQLTVQEVVDGLLKYRRMRNRVWSGIGILILGILEVIYSQQSAGSQWALFAGCTFITLGIIFSLFAPLSYRRAYTKAVRANPAFTEEREVYFEDAGLLFSSPNRRSEVTWAVFKKMTEDEKYFYLHTDDLGTVTILPKQAFDAAGLESFRRCSQSVPRA